MIASLLISSLLLAAQPAVVSPVPPPSLSDARLAACLEMARSDPVAATAEAEGWRDEFSTGSRASPLQCLGTAYANRSMWAEAEATFADAAADLAGEPVADPRRLSAFHSQAGNAALAMGDAADALKHFNAGLAALNGTAVSGAVAAAAHIDRARALVALSRDEEAVTALTFAQESNPQDATAFLLSATLSRRNGELAEAARAIAMADALSPNDGEIVLEGGLIAALAGDDLTAAGAWRRIVEGAPNTPEAERAQFYLEQLNAMRSAEMAEDPALTQDAPPQMGVQTMGPPETHIKEDTQ